MTIIDNAMLWRQFNASLDMLESALRDCPDGLWQARLWDDHADQWVADGFSSFWYLAYHTLFWLDLYLTGAEEGFVPPLPFDLVEMEANERLPRVYSREELLGYLGLCRRRAEGTIIGLSAADAARLCRFPWGEVAFAELQLYSLRHIMEHGAQLRLFLGQRAHLQAEWSSGLQE